jgi:hypothetical protein
LIANRVKFIPGNNEAGMQNLTVKACKIKDLELKVEINHKYNIALKPTNNAFQFILKSCPLPKKFDLSGDISHCASGSAFNLWFTNNLNLKYISVKIRSDYYTFSAIPERVGKHYKGFKLLAKVQQTSKNFYIDLTWGGS